MRRLRRPTPALIASVCLLVLIGLRLLNAKVAIDGQQQSIQTVTVSRVLDGDTFDCTDGQRVRLLGIDAPEVARGEKPSQPFADHSTEILKQWIDNKQVQLRSGREPFDRYGRTLAWVYTMDDQLVNAELLRQGAAKLLPDYGLPPELEPLLRAAEAEARVRRAGLWRKK